MRAPRVYLVTERCEDLPGRVRRALSALPAGIAAVQLRDKEMPACGLLALAHELAGVCHELGHRLLVNDRLDVALAAGADGVHLPSAGIPPAEARRLMGPQAFLGVSCHGEEEVRRALEGGADFATFGPVFETPSKRVYGSPVGLEALRSAARLGLPLVALGGIEAANARAAIEAGAWGLAAIRAWLYASDPAEGAQALAASLEGGR